MSDLVQRIGAELRFMIYLLFHEYYATIMQPAADTNSLLSANGHPARESDLSYSQFSVNQSMPTRYANSVSSINDPTISIVEVNLNTYIHMMYLFCTF